MWTIFRGMLWHKVIDNSIKIMNTFIMHTKNYYKISIPINITIFTAFTIALLILVSIIISVNYSRNIEMAFETAEMIMEKNSKQIFMKIETLYEPLLNITNQASELPIFGVKPTLTNHPAENYLLNSIDSYPQIQVLYMGYSDGDFYEILSCKGELKDILQKTVIAPVETEFAILRQFTVPGQDEPVRIWKFLNSSRQTIGSRKEDFTGYDPRIRPWFINAINEHKSIKTDPYYFTNVKQMGLTISHTIEGDVNGVLGADILMSQMTTFLDGLKENYNEEILIFNKDMYITAGYKGNSNNKSLVPMSDIDSDLIKIFQTYIEENGISDDMNININTQNYKYLVKVKALPEKYSNNEYLFIAVKETDVILPIIETVKKSSLISIIVMFLSLPVFLFIARRISAPINKLVLEANKISNFDLKHDIVIKTRIKEISRLTKEMASMKRGLRLFNRYVPSQLVKALMMSGEDAQIGGTLKDMTVLFTDIEDFTSISEITAPEELMLRLSSYLSLLSTIICRNRGTVDKFIGDSVMAFWNAPVDDDNHIINACYTALEIQRKVRKLNNYWQKISRPPFKTRIGIHSGNVIVGNMGSKDRMNYTVLGDVVNTSNRLESINKCYGTEIIIGEIVAMQLTDNFVIRPLEKVIVKGKSVPETIYELIGMKENISHDQYLMSEITGEAFLLYHDQRWEEAVEMFEKVLILSPNDITTNAHIESCRENIIDPPGIGWDGIKRMRVK